MAGRQKKRREPTASPGPGAVLRLDRIVGNREIRRLLEGALVGDRLFPSLLFHGPAGVGKLTTARALAASLNCLARDGVQACGACVPCRKIASWVHPDVKVLESEASAREAGRPSFFPATSAEAARSSPTRDRGRLLIAQVRNLVRETGFRPFEGQRRVFIVRDLETDPGQGCANVLLKTLEEPPADTVLVVVTRQPERLPITVRSRCHGVSFVAAPLPDVVTFLEAKGIEPDEARWRAAWSGGRPGAALRLDAASRLESRDALLEALTAALDGGPAAAAAVAEPFGRRGVDLLPTLDDLALIVRDLMIWTADPEQRLITNRDRLGDMERLAAAIPSHRAARLLTRITWCALAAERNVNAGLMWQTLFLEAGGHLPAEPLTDPWLPGNPAAENPR